MPKITIGDEIYKVEGIVKFYSGISIERAATALSDNGFDEIYFIDPETKNKYVAYGKGLYLNSIPNDANVRFKTDGGDKIGKVISYSNELNSFGEGVWSHKRTGYMIAGGAAVGTMGLYMINFGKVGISFAKLAASRILSVGAAAAGGGAIIATLSVVKLFFESLQTATRDTDTISFSSIGANIYLRDITKEKNPYRFGGCSMSQF